MQISYEWLLEYLPFEVSVSELSEILTSIGLEVEDIEVKEKVKGSLKGVVVGEVIHCEQHPNADRLKKTQVKIADETILDIVCGAPNVAQGQKVVVATVGTSLYPNNATEAFVIKASKIRGEKSEGMLCAEDELGLGHSHDGIIVLDPSTPIGTPAHEVFQLPQPQSIYHIGLTPNRSDAMSHIGVAQDVIAYWNYHHKTNYTIKLPTAATAVPNGPDNVQVTVRDTDLCQRFAAVVMDNVHVAESPEWLKNRLEAIGVRSINNVVDISNYVLHEWGQPIHIYDFNQVKDAHLIVQHSQPYTTLHTLDKQEIKLHAEDILIADTQQALGLAGVMGGLSSSVQNSTSKVIIESAAFNPKWIRRTSLRHNLRTEAAIHFEKSTSIDKVDKALYRVMALLQECAQAQMSSELVDYYPQPMDKKHVTFKFEYIRKICGKNYSEIDMLNILKNLGFEVISQDNEQATVAVPYNKTDISLPADIAEEILRIDGLNNVAINTTIQFSINSQKTSPRKINNKICDYLSHNGFQEILTNSIINSQNYTTEGVVKMMNSLSAELDAMRPELCRSGLEVIEYNVNRGQKNLFFYELGQTYKQVGEAEFNQTSVLGIWCTGSMVPKQWFSNETKVNIYWLKGIISNLLQHIGIKKYTLQEHNGQLEYKVGKEVLGQIKILDKKSLSSAGIKQEVIYAEFYPQNLYKYINTSIQYKPLNKYPQMERDLSIIIDAQTTYDAIEKVNNQFKSPLLKSIRVFDIYEGQNVGDNKKSWSMNYTFQSEDRTLTDTEVDEVMSQIMQTYHKELNAEIRK